VEMVKGCLVEMVKGRLVKMVKEPWWRW